jgi:hypothetical protein
MNDSPPSLRLVGSSDPASEPGPTTGPALLAVEAAARVATLEAELQVLGQQLEADPPQVEEKREQLAQARADLRAARREALRNAVARRLDQGHTKRRDIARSRRA